MSGLSAKWSSSEDLIVHLPPHWAEAEAEAEAEVEWIITRLIHAQSLRRKVESLTSKPGNAGRSKSDLPQLQDLGSTPGPPRSRQQQTPGFRFDLMYALRCRLLRPVAREIPRVMPRYPFDRRSFHNSPHRLAVTTQGQREIEITNKDSVKLKLSLLWLRDHCHCTQCVNQDTKQKSFDTFTVPHDAAVQYGTDSTGLWVSWDNDHIGKYKWNWLFQHQHERPYPIKHKYWGSEIKTGPPSVHYDEVMASDDGVRLWTSKIAEYGFCFVDGCPTSPDKTKELLERIAFIRVTHYGGFYDFTSDLTIKDTAYTSLALPAHTDNTYFTDPSGLQMFHLLSHTDGTGGASLLVDGFHCTKLLLNASPTAYEILSKYPIRWHASGNEGISITPACKFPVLNCNKDLEDSAPLVQVRWNNDDRATMPYREQYGIKMDEWYDAARIWNSIITDHKNEYREQLVPGRPVVFDNWRVLHGRSAFTGKRRICGGYINRDDFMSRYLITNLGRYEVLNRII